MKELLEETYGVMVYQEDVLKSLLMGAKLKAPNEMELFAVEGKN